jgi:hypothetical protein
VLGSDRAHLWHHRASGTCHLPPFCPYPDWKTTRGAGAQGHVDEDDCNRRGMHTGGSWLQARDSPLASLLTWSSHVVSLEIPLRSRSSSTSRAHSSQLVEKKMPRSLLPSKCTGFPPGPLLSRYRGWDEMHPPSWDCSLSVLCF